MELAVHLTAYAPPRLVPCQFILSFGYPENPEAPTWPKRAGGRKPLAEIVHHEHW